MLKAEFAPYELVFKEPARTSRQVMQTKSTYFIKVWEEDSPDIFGLGECALFKGLSCDDVPDYEDKLSETCRDINILRTDDLLHYPSIRCGVETALFDLKNGGVRCPFPSPWSEGKDNIVINGLVWMGSIDQMSRRIEEKLRAGFKCLKFKVGGEDFEQEYSLLDGVRRRFGVGELTIRLDANGAFMPEDALTKLDRLSALDIHSIEQPIHAGQIEEMARICAESPIPVALDEELIGVNDTEQKYKLLERINPRYIILKPALCGGFSGSMEWISIANLLGIEWWATSALESNVGLNAIAQWLSGMQHNMPQGLGTGALYLNNIASPVSQEGEGLIYKPSFNWELPELSWRS